MCCIMHCYFNNNTPWRSWLWLIILSKGGDVTAGSRAITGVIHHVRPYLRKSMVRKHIDDHIKTIVVLTGGKLTGFYFLHLLSAIYYSVMMHLWKGKKISFLLPGDVNSELIPSRWGLLEDNPYRAVGVVSYPSSKRGESKLSYVCPGCSNHTYGQQ
jgi:hypothetical protein